MPALTRRRDRNLPQECWRVYYGDVHVGTIARCVGNPGAAPKWQWRCGFYPGSRPSECTGGTAETFDKARAAFGRAWAEFLAKRTEVDFQAWREQQAWTAEKYRRFGRDQRAATSWALLRISRRNTVSPPSPSSVGNWTRHNCDTRRCDSSVEKLRGAPWPMRISKT